MKRRRKHDGENLRECFFLEKHNDEEMGGKFHDAHPHIHRASTMFTLIRKKGKIQMLDVNAKFIFLSSSLQDVLTEKLLHNIDCY